MIYILIKQIPQDTLHPIEFSILKRKNYCTSTVVFSIKETT